MRLFSLVGLAPMWREVRGDRPAKVVEGPTIAAVARPENLARAWGRVRANKGGPGGDGVMLDDFARASRALLSTLSTQLLDDTYRPGRLRRLSISKPDGRRRKLAIPAVVDRIAQTALLIVLAPYVDPRMSEASWA